MTPTDPNRLIAGLARDGISLDLKTVDLCFLAPGADSPRKRATHSIQRLREQHMLARVDGAGLVKAGEYTLTRLAAAVVDYFLADEGLTRESLTLLTGALRAQLAQVLSDAKVAADDGESWRQHVIAPLRVTVADLIQGIERRQRGLDAQQEAVQSAIAELLQADWFGAVDRCQALLDTTTTTLKELNEVLLWERTTSSRCCRTSRRRSRWPGMPMPRRSKCVDTILSADRRRIKTGSPEADV